MKTTDIQAPEFQEFHERVEELTQLGFKEVYLRKGISYRMAMFCAVSECGYSVITYKISQSSSSTLRDYREETLLCDWQKVNRLLGI